MRKDLQRYIGKLVQLRPGSFSRLLTSIGHRSMALENRFLVGAANRRLGCLICYGSGLRLEMAPVDIELV